MVKSHNEAIKRGVIADTEELRDKTRGKGVVSCPECQEDVAWGNILSHRLETCVNTRVVD